MSRKWTRSLRARKGDAALALIERGRRISQAQQELPPDEYLKVITSIGMTPRDAGILASIGKKLGPLTDTISNAGLPFRMRTLSALSELPAPALQQAVAEGHLKPSMTEAEVKAFRPLSSKSLSSVIKPTDNWNFSKLWWPRINDQGDHGYIPGDLYVNCLWYYAKDGDTVTDPMAGSGMLLRVWEERSLWLNSTSLNLNIVLSDLIPRGPYQKQIEQCDLLTRFPSTQSDYIIVDPPYCGLCKGQYSEMASDLANMEPREWHKAMQIIARRFRNVQDTGGRCTVIVPNNRNLNTGDRLLFPEIVRQIWYQNDYQLYDIAYASRRSQQKQNARMAILNNRAKRDKVPLTDISEILTFVAC